MDFRIVFCSLALLTAPVWAQTPSSTEQHSTNTQPPSLPIEPAPSSPKGQSDKHPAPSSSTAQPGTTKPIQPQNPHQQASAPASRARPRSHASELDKMVKPPPRVLHLHAGVNVLFGVALNDLNRLVTPFDDPAVETTSNAIISTSDNVVYVAPRSRAPIGFFIHPKGSQSPALSVTLVPVKIPPVSVRLELAGYVPSKALPVQEFKRNATRAASWETALPFTKTLKSLFKGLAKGKVPDGFGFSVVKDGHTDVMPACHIPGLSIVPRQLLTGYDIDAVVALVTNTSRSTKNIDETACKGKSVLAVAAWPHTQLKPGESTELYIAVRAPKDMDPDSMRPSLLGKGGR